MIVLPSINPSYLNCHNEVKLLESSEYEVTDFKKVLDDGRYRRDSREEEAEYAKNGSTIQTVGEDGFEDYPVQGYFHP